MSKLIQEFEVYQTADGTCHMKATKVLTEYVKELEDKFNNMVYYGSRAVEGGNVALYYFQSEIDNREKDMD